MTRPCDAWGHTAWLKETKHEDSDGYTILQYISIYIYIILISIYFILFLKEGNIVLKMKLFDPPDSAGASQYYPFQPAELCSQKTCWPRQRSQAAYIGFNDTFAQLCGVVLSKLSLFIYCQMT